MNDKVKSLFFSQYLGQKFIVTDRLERKDRDIHVLEEFTLDAVNIGGAVFDDSIEMDIVINACALLLRDVKQMTVAEHELCAKYNDMYIIKIHTLLGILTPFTYMDENGIPKTMQPAEIINLGWAKLQSNEQ